MNSRHSRLLTLRLANSCGARKTLWRGRSLSNAKLSSPAPISTTPSRPRCQRQRLDREAGRRRELAISGLERVLGESREDVGEEQLLVLLLMVDAELDHVERRGRKRRQRALQRLVDVRAIGADLVERGAAQHPAPGPRVARAFALVIAVEQKGVALVEQAIAGDMVAQHEGFEEPGRMGEMPFRRRSVGEGLDRGVGIRQRRGEAERQLAGGEQPLAERLGGRILIERGLSLRLWHSGIGMLM